MSVACAWLSIHVCPVVWNHETLSVQSQSLSPMMYYMTLRELKVTYYIIGDGLWDWTERSFMVSHYSTQCVKYKLQELGTSWILFSTRITGNFFSCVVSHKYYLINQKFEDGVVTALINCSVRDLEGLPRGSPSLVKGRGAEVMPFYFRFMGLLLPPKNSWESMEL